MSRPSERQFWTTWGTALVASITLVVKAVAAQNWLEMALWAVAVLFLLLSPAP